MSRAWCATRALPLLLGFCSACASRVAPPAHELPVANYVFGAFGGRSIDVRDVCASGEATAFELRHDVWDYLASLVSLGLYLPHHVRIWCREAPAS